LANSFNDDELTYDDEDAIGSEGSSVYISDDDSQSNKSSASEEIRSINFLKQQQTLQPTVKLVDKTPNLDAVKVNPLVKKRLNERRNAVSVQNDEGKSDEEDDPQDDMPSVFDFVTAVFYILFGVIAATAGLYSSLLV
jgi:hypothetical protein